MLLRSSIDAIYQIARHLAYQDIEEFKNTSIYELLYMRKELCRQYLEDKNIININRDDLIDLLKHNQNTLNSIFGLVDEHILDNSYDRGRTTEYKTFNTNK